MANKRSGKDRRRFKRADDSERRGRLPKVPEFQLDWVIVGILLGPVLTLLYGAYVTLQF
jgi:hypothetical protein